MRMQAASSKDCLRKVSGGFRHVLQASCSGTITRMAYARVFILSSARLSTNLDDHESYGEIYIMLWQGGPLACLEGDDCVARGEGAAGDVDHQDKPQQVVRHRSIVPACSAASSHSISHSQRPTQGPEESIPSLIPANTLMCPNN